MCSNEQNENKKKITELIVGTMVHVESFCGSSDVANDAKLDKKCLHLI